MTDMTKTQVTMTMQRLDILVARQQEHLSLINAAMASLHLPDQLQHRITTYHSFLAVHHNQPAAHLHFTRFWSLHTCILRDFGRCRPVFFAMRERARA